MPSLNAISAQSGDVTEAAADLFAALRALDSVGRTIAVIPIPEQGLGEAINDRLRRAAARGADEFRAGGNGRRQLTRPRPPNRAPRSACSPARLHQRDEIGVGLLGSTMRSITRRSPRAPPERGSPLPLRRSARPPLDHAGTLTLTCRRASARAPWRRAPPRRA